MIDTYKFYENSLVVPPEEKLYGRKLSDVTMYFVEKGTIVEITELFHDVFDDDYEYLRIIPMPDIDLDDVDAIDATVNDYEENPSRYECNGVHEIARVYH